MDEFDTLNKIAAAVADGLDFAFDQATSDQMDAVLLRSATGVGDVSCFATTPETQPRRAFEAVVANGALAGVRVRVTVEIVEPEALEFPTCPNCLSLDISLKDNGVGICSDCGAQWSTVPEAPVPVAEAV